MIDLRGKELKYAKELFLNICTKFCQNMWVELKL